MTETQLKTKVVCLLKRELPGAYILHPSEKFVSGVPDLFILHHGVFAAIELKIKGNSATRLQLVTLQRLSDAGAITAVCYELDEVRRVVHKIVSKVLSRTGEHNG